MPKTVLHQCFTPQKSKDRTSAATTGSRAQRQEEHVLHNQGGATYKQYVTTPYVSHVLPAVIKPPRLLARVPFLFSQGWK